MNDQTLDWLPAKDNPSVRYFALRYLLDRTEDDRDVQAARRAIMRSVPVQKILAAQKPEGYWFKPGAGYSPKYESTVWQILFLAELGADGRNNKVRKGCEYLLEHAQAKSGGFSAGQNAPPGYAIHCLNGNLIWALVALGYGDDARVARAVDWLAGSITGDDFPWFNAIVPGPGFKCGVNDKKPCAWGAVKSLRALANLPRALQSRQVKKATAIAIEFLLSRDLAKADYPYRGRISGEWFKFGFPLSYTSDVLEALLALAQAGQARDPRLQNAIAFVLSKRDADGRWALKHTLSTKVRVTGEKKGEPSKWVTLRALRVLKAAKLEIGD
ncbi:MAG: nitrogen fixation protein NifH [Chloroflexi bacterium]|nr:nitrogen fixation protein NifH [Chloroflexota bacterium]